MGKRLDKGTLAIGIGRQFGDQYCFRHGRESRQVLPLGEARGRQKFSGGGDLVILEAEHSQLLVDQF